MFSSLVDFFSTEKKIINTKKRRSSSLQRSLPTILLTTTCIDFEPLSPLTTTDPINVPLTYHSHGKAYSSSLDSLSTSRSNSLASSVSLSSSSSSSYGCPTTPVSSSLSDDNNDDDPLSISCTINSAMDPLSCGNPDGTDHSRHQASAVILKSISQPVSTTKIESKVPLFENFRHSLSFFAVPSFTSTMPWTTPPSPTPPSNEIATPTKTSTTTTVTTATTAVTYDDVFFEEDCTMTTKSIPEHPHQYHPQPMYTRALRENPAHLRMIVSEVNMMRVNKLISPLRPRAFLLERTDPFIPSTPSPLRHIV